MKVYIVQGYMTGYAGSIDSVRTHYQAFTDREEAEQTARHLRSQENAFYFHDYEILDLEVK